MFHKLDLLPIRLLKNVGDFLLNLDWVVQTYSFESIIVGVQCTSIDCPLSYPLISLLSFRTIN